MLSANFDIKDLGEADVILGIKITRTENGIFLDQSHYIEKILKKYNYFDSKPAYTPYDSSVKLFKNTDDNVNQSEYASIISSLSYAANCTKSDIAYVIGLLCRFTSRLSQNLGLHYNKFPVVLKGYSNADWNSLSDVSKATSGYIFNIGGVGAWKSKKQTIVAQSTMELEMIALAAANEEPSCFSKLTIKDSHMGKIDTSHTNPL
ncbi:Retrovirus-related Pol polyprotein from transposon TNT 1-94 [Cucumis melo var. makuwa]|uniref:Retrovirus-related Pol polyprotein from transposon TNT 1-94 n=1 Tax=Cucumis melo var. makuwa TaxID=1194695 RepID=A0A5D3BCE8_CUCMM|nr:Retrovirus-related Pol polyprotein from transposon TNT 1-94 [Cucumis melo var. makuwa]